MLVGHRVSFDDVLSPDGKVEVEVVRYSVRIILEVVLDNLYLHVTHAVFLQRIFIGIAVVIIRHFLMATMVISYSFLLKVGAVGFVEINIILDLVMDLSLTETYIVLEGKNVSGITQKVI